MNLSFFTNYGIGSGKIRGDQIANYMGAKLNPTWGYENDICIYVKKQPPDNFPKTSYFDIVDGKEHLGWLQNHPEIGVIGMTKPSQFFLSNILSRDNIHIIPQHHCNFEGTQREPREVKVVGYIGGERQLQYNYKKLEFDLSKVGLDFKFKTIFNTRKEVVDFLNSIDINIAFRLRIRGRQLRGALKLANAGSFGIPSVAYPEIGYEAEFKDCYLKATTEKDLISGCKRLMEDTELYDDIAKRALVRSGEYHISKIAPLYEKLK